MKGGQGEKKGKGGKKRRIKGKLEEQQRKKKRRPRKRLNMRTNGKTNERNVSNACLENAWTIMRMWKDVIANFHKQKIRMNRQIQTGASKFGKSQVFVGAFQNLKFAGGNNKDNLTCNGSTTNSGAVQLKNLTGTLSLCTSEITKACNTSSWPQPDKTKLAECETLAGRFDKEASACVTETVLESNTSIACACWGGAGFNKTVQAVKQCKFSKEAEKVKKAMKACSEAFRKCRKYEDAAITTVSDCATNKI